MISPSRRQPAFVLPGCRYYFKKSLRRAPEQFWNEVIAYRLGLFVGAPVPPTYAAHNSLKGECGALSEWFYDRDGSGAESFSASPTILAELISNYSGNKGTGYNFEAISEWLEFLQEHRHIRGDWTDHWAKVFVLDALMGNTDRHQENWGLVWQEPREDKNFLKLTPAFDNGTSLGYELNAPRMRDLRDDAKLLRYIKKGRACMLWDERDTSRLPHPEFLKKFFNKHGKHRAAALSRLGISDDALVRTVMVMMQAQSPMALSQSRAQMMIRLLLARRHHLRECLSEGPRVISMPHALFRADASKGASLG